MKRIVSLLFVVAVVACGVLARTHVWSGANAQQDASAPAPLDLEREFADVEPPSGSGGGTPTIRRTERTLLVTARYRYPRDFALVRAHYDHELTSKGWQFVGERVVRDWWRDLGGRVIVYCKQGNAASVTYAGAQANYGWTYVFDVSRGFEQCPAWRD